MENCVSQIEKLIDSEPVLKSKVEKLITIKGVGLITVASIIAETFGFEETNNAKQLASFAGYEVVDRQSGTSIKGKTAAADCSNI